MLPFDWGKAPMAVRAMPNKVPSAQELASSGYFLSNPTCLREVAEQINQPRSDRHHQWWRIKGWM